MAEIVKVPVLGNVKKPWLYAGGAAVAGIVGYAWWTKGAIVEDTGFAVELPATEFTPPTVVDSGISVGNTTPTPGIAENNVEWANMAREQAAGLGFSIGVTASALTKYLGKVSLTPTEASLIRGVVAILGQPPQNGPYTITESGPEPPPTHDPGTKVTGLRWEFGGRNSPGYWDLPESYRGVVAWTPVVGATGYRVRALSGTPMVETDPFHAAVALAPGSHTYYVTPLFADKLGEEASISFSVTS